MTNKNVRGQGAKSLQLQTHERMTGKEDSLSLPTKNNRWAHTSSSIFRDTKRMMVRCQNKQLKLAPKRRKEGATNLVGVGSRAVASTAFSFTESIAILTVPRFEPLLRMLPNRFETGNENGFRREGGFDEVESGSGVDLKLSTSSENLDPITCVVADMTGMEKVVSMW